MSYALGMPAAMPWPILPRNPLQMPNWMTEITREVDWEKLGAVAGGVVTIALILRALFKPLWEKLVKAAMGEHIARYDKAEELAQANADKISALEAAVLAQGAALRDMPRLITTTESLCDTISKLDKTLQEMDKDVREMGEWRKYVQGVWDGEERRNRQDPHHPRRRRDDG